MLFLKHAGGTARSSPAEIPLEAGLASLVERAILSEDPAVRAECVRQAVASDAQFASWAMAAAEIHLGRTVNCADDAVRWLSDRLIGVFSSSLSSKGESAELGDIEWRLPALVARLADAERQAADFEGRLQREKLDSMKELAYGASHEINNPLANIAARAQSLLGEEQDPERRQKLIAIHRQAMRAHEMISDLMLFARPPKLQIAAVSVGSLVGEVLAGLGALAGENQVQLEFASSQADITVRGDKTQLGVAIHALVKNAIEAVDEGGQVRVSVGTLERGGTSWAEIVVRDDGPGIAPEVRGHIFDPFFSGREAGRGLGFGLSKCWRIVTDHGGDVVVRASSLCGAEFAILLPLAVVEKISAESC